MERNQKKSYVLTKVVSLLDKTLEMNVNSNSCVFMYQPKMPEKLIERIKKDGASSK